MSSSSPYEPPVDQLLTLGADAPAGEPSPLDWPDYPGMGLIAADHAEDLIRLATDKQLHNTPGRSRPEAWGPVHAWRALGRLGVAAAVDPLLQTLAYLSERMGDAEEGLLLEEIAYVLAMIGEPAIEPAGEFAHNATQNPSARITASGALALMSRFHPDCAGACVERVSGLLKKAQWNDPVFNSYVVADLVDMKAADALDLIEQTYAKGYVSGTTIGSFEDARQKILEDPEAPA